MKRQVRTSDDGFAMLFQSQHGESHHSGYFQENVVVSAQAEMGLKNFSECIADCKKVLQLDQQNRDAKILLRQAIADQKEADKKSKAVFASNLARIFFCGPPCAHDFPPE